MDPLESNTAASAEADTVLLYKKPLTDVGSNSSVKKVDLTITHPDIPTSAEAQRDMEDLESVDYINPNVKCETMTLYNHDPDSTSRNAKWSEFEDLAAEERRIKELGKGFAVIHRRSKVEKDGNETWITHSIEAQSPKLRILLSEIFRDYPGWYPDSAPYAVRPPFKPYVHRWDTILELSKKLDSAAAKELRLLLHELEQPITSHLAALRKVKKTGTVSFEALWLILSPGCLVVSDENGHTCVSRLLKIKFVPGRYPYWDLDFVRVNWNGSVFGLEVGSGSIGQYTDSILISKLPFYPIEFATDRKGIEEKLLARGRKFESLRGFHVKSCKTKKYTKHYNRSRATYEQVEKPVSGRVIVDAYAYHKIQKEVPRPLMPLIKSSEQLGTLLELNDMVSEDEDIDDSPYRSPAQSDTEQVRRRRRHSSDTASEKVVIVSEDRDQVLDMNDDIVPLTDLECILAVPRVKGFDLSVKEWCKFDVDDIEDTVWDETPYNNLVLPEGEKELAMAFADRPRLNTQGFDDFIANKGEGIIILLCGPPGVGKTLTAEAMAEKSRVPLYILSAGDLGTSSERIEAGLMKALECCQMWDAILLLDEADVFLEARDNNSLDRNELVSIFLRRLEYYQGLMFLTTNRLSVIDPAFKSRLDLILPYQDLDESSRRKVWVNFIQKVKPEITTISDSDFDEFAKAQLNGREIKNSIKTALILASCDKPFRAKHLTTVLNIRKRVVGMESAGKGST